MRSLKRLLSIFVLALTMTGCAALLPYLVAAGQVIQWITTVVDQVDARQDRYFDNQPNPGLQVQVESAIAKVRMAAAALNEAIAAAEDTNDAKVEEAKKHLVQCYDELYRLLESFGLLGVDGELGVAPGMTQQLPTPEQLGARLGL